MRKDRRSENIHIFCYFPWVSVRIHRQYSQIMYPEAQSYLLALPSLRIRHDAPRRSLFCSGHRNRANELCPPRSPYAIWCPSSKFHLISERLHVCVQLDSLPCAFVWRWSYFWLFSFFSSVPLFSESIKVNKVGEHHQCCHYKTDPQSAASALLILARCISTPRCLRMSTKFRKCWNHHSQNISNIGIKKNHLNGGPA